MRNYRHSKTFRMVPVPSFFSGMARIFDFAGSLNAFKYAKMEPKQADFLALKADWEMVGDDLKRAMDNYADRKSQ